MDIDTLVLAQVLFVFMLTLSIERIGSFVISLRPQVLDADVPETGLSMATVTTLVVGFLSGLVVVNYFDVDLIKLVFNIESNNFELFNAVGLAIGAEFWRPVRKRLMAKKGEAPRPEWLR